MTEGTSQGLFVVVAIVIFGIFVGLSYTIFGSVLQPQLVSLFENGTYSEQYQVTDESYFDITSEGVLTGFSEKGYSDRPLDIVIPEQINGITVTSIGEYAFDTSSEDNPPTIEYKLESVVIPPSVTRIEGEAFSTNSISKVVLPSKLEFIGRYAFDNSNITELVIPNSVKTIERWAFYGNPLTNVKLSNNLEFIGNHAFYGNYFSELTIPKSVNTIEKLAFMGKKDAEVTIPQEYADWTSTRTVAADAFTTKTTFKVLID